MQMIWVMTAFLVTFGFLAGGYLAVTYAGHRRRKAQIRTLLKRDPAPDRGQTQSPRTAGPPLLFGILDMGRLENLLTAAGVSVSPFRFSIMAASFGLLCFLATLVVSHHLAGALVAMGVAAGLPFLYLVHRRRRQEDLMIRQMPDTLDMIVRALRVGQSVDNALKEVGQTCPPPLGAQFETIYEETALGIPFSAALHNFEHRFARLPDVKLMVTAFVIQRETGGNLTGVLANLSNLIRQRDTVKRQIRALTAEGRSSAAILGALPMAVGLFFWFIRPDYIRVLFDHTAGRQMVLLAVLLEIVGFLTMRAMTRLDA